MNYKSCVSLVLKYNFEHEGILHRKIIVYLTYTN